MRFLVIFLTIAIAGPVAYYVFVREPAASPEQPVSDSTVAPEASEDATEIPPGASEPAGTGTVPPSGGSDTPAPAPSTPPSSTAPDQPIVTSSGATVVLPYREVILQTDYEVGWYAPKGARATLALTKNGTTYSTMEECTDMTLRSGVAYCTWNQWPLTDVDSMEGYRFTLSVFDADGAVVDRAQSQTLALVPRTEYRSEPYRDNSFGWSVRHPLDWSVAPLDARTVIAGDSAGLAAPLASREAFVITYCSSAREDCQRTIDAFRAAPGRGDASLGGKLSLRRVYQENGTFIVEDMLLRSGLAYFVTRKAADANGTVLSPYVRESLASFNYETTRTEVDVYELDEMFREGTLLVEYKDSKPAYARIYTGGDSCYAELASDSFIKTQRSNFSFVVDGCRLEGTVQQDGTLELEEKDCENARAEACEFEGMYEPAD